MPQFDSIIIFTIINDFIVIIILYYLLTLQIILNNVVLSKFRIKNLEIKKYFTNINELDSILFLKIN